jgi:ABC-type glycerol-3-phosphate transport system permease component
MGFLQLRGRFFFSRFLVAIQMLPSVVSIVPLYIICGKMGILNTYNSLVFSYLGGTVPVAVILLYGFFVDIPSDLGEAAMIDGCNTWRMFRSVILPVAIPGIVSCAIYTFIRVWQEFIIALSFTTNKSMYTLTIGLRAYEGSNQTDWGGLMATAVVISIPAIILFAVVQKQFVDSMSGSVKG